MEAEASDVGGSENEALECFSKDGIRRRGEVGDADEGADSEEEALVCCRHRAVCGVVRVLCVTFLGT